MESTVLIDAIVRQTTVLVAQLATSSGSRLMLAHTANQVFVDLVRELKEQGLGNKVIADMFGLALRTYHDKVRRLSESNTVRGRSLWDATLEFIQDKGVVLQTDVLMRFRHDDEATVRSVLLDLVDSGMVFRSGRGPRTTFRAAKSEEVVLTERDPGESALHLAWVAVSRFGPAGVDAVLEVVPLERTVLETALERLVQEGRVEKVVSEGAVQYRTDLCLIPFQAPEGWEAAVFDHYQAVVTAICAKLTRGTNSAAADDRIGGSTYTFTVWPGHPHYEEVMGLLGRMRGEVIELRKRVTLFNAAHAAPEGAAARVISYMGQTVLEPETNGECQQ